MCAVAPSFYRSWSCGAWIYAGLGHGAVVGGLGVDLTLVTLVVPLLLYTGGQGVRFVGRNGREVPMRSFVPMGTFFSSYGGRLAVRFTRS